MGAHADHTQRRRGCSSSLGTHHTVALTPQHTRTPHAHMLQYPWKSRVERCSNPGSAASTPGVLAARAMLSSHIKRLTTCNFKHGNCFPMMCSFIHKFNEVLVINCNNDVFNHGKFNPGYQLYLAKQQSCVSDSY